MREKMGGIKAPSSNWAAPDDNTVTFDSEYDIPDKGVVANSVTITLNGDGKIIKWASARK